MITLNNKNAIVTGAGNGIGLEIVKAFKESGAFVIGVDLVVKEEKKIEGTDYRLLDVSSYNQVQSFAEKVIEDYGHIDILVNCAGITRDAMTRKMSEEQFDQVVAVNLKGVWNLTRFIGPHMQANKTGSIINISSVVGIYGNIGQSNYAATKAGVIGMTKSWAKEFATKGGNVRVNAVAPGYTMTDMMKTVPEELLEKFRGQTMLGRLAEPVEIANSVLFLASDLASYVTGEVLNVNGGMRL